VDWRYALGVRALILAAALALVGRASVASGQVLPAPGLGGPLSAFEQILGGPNDASIGALRHYQRCAGTQMDQFVLLAPNDQVWTIQRTWCSLTTIPADQRLADAAQFLPPDAVAGEPFTTALGESALTYASPGLAATLPPSLFHDCTGQAVPPGTLFVVADTFGGWYMGPGTCPGG
jgi:hypothetical protein